MTSEILLEKKMEKTARREFLYVDGGKHVIYFKNVRNVGDSFLVPRGSYYKRDCTFKDLDDGRITVLSTCGIILNQDEK